MAASASSLLSSGDTKGERRDMAAAMVATGLRQPAWQCCDGVTVHTRSSEGAPGGRGLPHATHGEFRCAALAACALEGVGLSLQQDRDVRPSGQRPETAPYPFIQHQHQPPVPTSQLTNRCPALTQHGAIQQHLAHPGGRTRRSGNGRLIVCVCACACMTVCVCARVRARACVCEWCGEVGRLNPNTA